MKRIKAPKMKGKPFIMCKVAGYMELKTPLDTSEHRPSTQATDANRVPEQSKEIQIKIQTLKSVQTLMFWPYKISVTLF